MTRVGEAGYPRNFRAMTMIHPVVLCGGSGTRLWPRSRKEAPKPFLPLVGEETLFEGTLARCADSETFAPPVIVTGVGHRGHVESQAAARGRWKRSPATSTMRATTRARGGMRGATMTW